MVVRLLIQFFITSAALLSPAFALTISVMQIKSSSLIVVRAISIPWTVMIDVFVIIQSLIFSYSNYAPGEFVSEVV